MSFDLTALDTMVSFDGYEHAAKNFNAPGTYELAMKSKHIKCENSYLFRDGMCTPFNLNTYAGRMDGLYFLYDNLPLHIFKSILSWVFEPNLNKKDI